MNGEDAMFPEWSKLVLFILGYVVLMRWVLSAFGISTCMSGACRIPEAHHTPSEDAVHPPEGSGRA